MFAFWTCALLPEVGVDFCRLGVNPPPNSQAGAGWGAAYFAPGQIRGNLKSGWHALGVPLVNPGEVSGKTFI